MFESKIAKKIFTSFRINIENNLTEINTVLIQQTSLNINQQNRISFKENPNQSRYSQLHEDMERIAKITEPDIIKVKEPKKTNLYKKYKNYL